MNAPAIRAENLTKRFRVRVRSAGLGGVIRSLFNPEIKDVLAVDGMSFTIHAGEVVGLLGRNGAGKTTALKMMAGLLHPTSGRVEALGYAPWRRERPFQSSIALVMGQRQQLWWDLPAWETFLLNRAIYGLTESAFRSSVDELDRLLDLTPLFQIPVKSLSLGQRMKCELACSLLHRPKLLLLDEPTLGLDVVMQKVVREFLQKYNRTTGATMLVTSHNMADVEFLCGRVLVLARGRLVHDGPPATLAESHGEGDFEEAVRRLFAEGPR